MKRISFLFILLAILFGCQNKQEKSRKSVVTVSILPIKYFVERIGGEIFDVNVLVPPGSGPETYEPSPQEMIRVSNSVMFFKTGYYDIENLLSGKIKDMNKDLEIVDLSKGVEIIREAASEGHAAHSGGVDPHIWSGISSSRVLSSNILDALVRKFPEHKVEFEKNFKNLTKDIDSLDTYILRKLKGSKRTTFVMYHPSMGYFARDYQLNQIALEAEGKTPSASHLRSLIDLIRKEGIKTIFLQVQFDVHNTEAIANEIKGKVITIDPLNVDWLGNMYRMTDQISLSLNE